METRDIEDMGEHDLQKQLSRAHGEWGQLTEIEKAIVEPAQVCTRSFCIYVIALGLVFGEDF